VDPLELSLWGLVLAVCALLFVGGWVRFAILARRDARRLAEAAIPARARILAVSPLEESHVWLELELHVPGHPPRLVERSYNTVGEDPPVGAWLRVRIHPDHPNELHLDALEP
jgi:hypothetical protein